jgi:hypothetical protein
VKLSRLRDAEPRQDLQGAQAFHRTPGDAGTNCFRLQERDVERGIVGDDDPSRQPGEEIVGNVSERRGSNEVVRGDAVDPSPERSRAGINKRRPFVNRLAIGAHPDDCQLDNSMARGMQARCLDVNDGPTV